MVLRLPPYDCGPFPLFGNILDSAFLWPSMLLVGALLLGAAVIALFRRWQEQEETDPSCSASDQLAEFRELYEQGAISEEEYRRLRGVLSGEIRRSVDGNNSRIKDLGSEQISPSGQKSPDEPNNRPSTGIRPG